MPNIPTSRLTQVIQALRDYLNEGLNLQVLAGGVPLTPSIVAVEGAAAVFRPPMVVIAPTSGEREEEGPTSFWHVNFMAQIVIPLASEDFAPVLIFDSHEELLSLLQDYERNNTLGGLVRRVSLGRFSVRPLEVDVEMGKDIWYLLDQPFTMDISIPPLRRRS